MGNTPSTGPRRRQGGEQTKKHQSSTKGQTKSDDQTSCRSPIRLTRETQHKKTKQHKEKTTHKKTTSFRSPISDMLLVCAFSHVGRFVVCACRVNLDILCVRVFRELLCECISQCTDIQTSQFCFDLLHTILRVRTSLRMAHRHIACLCLQSCWPSRLCLQVQF